MCVCVGGGGGGGGEEGGWVVALCMCVCVSTHLLKVRLEYVFTLLVFCLHLLNLSLQSGILRLVHRNKKYVWVKQASHI